MFEKKSRGKVGINPNQTTAFVVAMPHWAMVTEIGTLVVGDVDPWRVRFTKTKVLERPRAAAILVDVQKVVVVGDDPESVVLSLADGHTLGRLDAGEHTHWVNDICALPRLGFVATASHDGTLRIWDLSGVSSRRVAKLEAGVRPQIVIAHPRQKHVLSSGDDRVLRAFRISPPSQAHAFGRRDPSTGTTDIGNWAASSEYLAIDSSGKRVLWEDRDGSIGIWDFRTGDLLGQISERWARQAYFISATDVVALTRQGEIKWFEAERGHLLDDWHAIGGCLSIAPTQDGEIVALCASGEVVSFARTAEHLT